MLPGLEQRRVHEGVLLDAKRPAPRVGRGDDAQQAAPVGRAEALLLVAGRELRLAGAKTDLEHVREVAARRVHLAVSDPAAGGATLELPGVDHARATHRVVVGERPLADVGHDLGVTGSAAWHARAGRQAALVEDLERPETFMERIAVAVAVAEREPGLLLAASAVVVPLLGP